MAVEKCGVAGKQMLRGIIEQADRDPPLPIHVIQVLGLVGQLRQAAPYRRRHEEGVRPPPDGLRRVVREKQDAVELRFERRNFPRVGGAAIKCEIGLTDGLVVGVGLSRSELPVEGFASLLDHLPVAWVPECVAGRDHARVERGESPILAGLRLDARQLPVGDLAHGGVDRAAAEAGGKVAERSRVSEGITGGWRRNCLRGGLREADFDRHDHGDESCEDEPEAPEPPGHRWAWDRRTHGWWVWLNTAV